MTLNLPEIDYGTESPIQEGNLERAFFGDTFHRKLMLPNSAQQLQEKLQIDINWISSLQDNYNQLAIEMAKEAAINEKEFFRCIFYSVKANLPLMYYCQAVKNKDYSEMFERALQ